MTPRSIFGMLALGMALSGAAASPLIGEDLLENYPIITPAPPESSEPDIAAPTWGQSVASTEHVMHDVPAPETPVRVARTVPPTEPAPVAAFKSGSSASAINASGKIASGGSASGNGREASAAVRESPTPARIFWPAQTSRDRWVLSFLALMFASGATITWAVLRNPKRPPVVLGPFVARPIAKGS